jgi:arsenate reductase (glutaredoxin)
VTKYTILHNPRCSKSREALQLLQQHQVSFDTVEYLKKPLNENELKQLFKKLNQSVLDGMRTNEKICKEHNIKKRNLSDKELLQFIAEHPTSLQRPIVFSDTKAVIARPPEILEKWLT